MLKNNYLVDLRMGQRGEKDARMTEISGNPASWDAAIWHYAQCEYASKIMELLPKVNWESINWHVKTDICFKMLVAAICRGDAESENFGLRDFAIQFLV